MKKYIPEHKVQRMRNLVTKNFGDKTKIQVGYGKNSKDHKEGDVWEEGGKTWTIKNGITQTVTKLDKARQKAIMPLFCPKCKEKHMKGQLDKLFWKLYGECSKCRVSFETDLKIKGKYVDYAKEIKQGNVKDWMKDLEAVAKDFIEETDRKGYVSETGRIEDWSGQNKKELEKTINESVKKLKQDLTSQLENLTNDK
tara:strand:+ start:125 stop:715 length:591 start_codon:yes stop_codon:yes gene_type:complete